MKQPAIMFVGLGPKQFEMLAPLFGLSSYVFLSTENPPPEFDAKERVICVRSEEQVLRFTQRAHAELENRVSSIMAMLGNGLKTAPGSDSGDLMTGELMQTLFRSLKNLFDYGFALDEACEKYDVRCVVSNLSFLDCQEGAIAAAHARGIPTLHLQHGVWISAQSYRPENADLVALADWFSQEIFNHQAPTPALGVVTGLPIYLELNRSALDPASAVEQRKAARSKLGLKADALIAVYAGTWSEGLYVGASSYAHEMVEALQDVIAVMLELEAQGRVTQIIYRQHPTVKSFEDEDAALIVAEDMGYSGLKVINHEKSQCLQAADMLITPRTQTSVLLDAFAEGCPVITLNRIPDMPGHIGEIYTLPLIESAPDRAALKTAALRLIDDTAHRQKLIKQAAEFMLKGRAYDEAQAKQNLQQLILELAETPRTKLQELAARWNQKHEDQLRQNTSEC